MVIEFLTFRVPPDELHGWLESDDRHWTRFLARQEGFVRKEMWRSVDDESTVHAVIWWASHEHWQAVPRDELAAVASAMGEHERPAECLAFEQLPVG